MSALDQLQAARNDEVVKDLALRRAELKVDQDAQSYGRVLALVALVAAIVVAADEKADLPTATDTVVMVAGMLLFVLVIAALIQNRGLNKKATQASEHLESARLRVVELEREEELAQRLVGIKAEPRPYPVLLHTGLVAGVLGGLIFHWRRTR